MALGIALIALPVYAADTMMATPACTADGMHAAMQDMAAKMMAIKLSASPDMDYAEAISQVMKMEHGLNAWEMKCGKNAKVMKMAGDMQQSLAPMMTHVNSLLQGG